MILLVEDDEDLREMMRTVLESRGFAVKEATDGVQALAILEKERPRLVILDLVMPLMTGWQVIAHMKERGIDVPVCVISALADRNPPEAVARLTKPF